MLLALRRRLRSNSGFTLVELIVVCATLGIVLAGLTNIFVSGERASQDDNAQMTGQQAIETTLGRLEYDARCASSASLISKSGSNAAGVSLVIPSWCAHSTGDAAWCVQSGSLVRIANATTCTGSGQTFATNVTSTTPFSCNAPTGTNAPLPQLDLDLIINPTGRSTDATTATDGITMRNAAAGACS
jgi:type II secretory pathway pseudopilin PulG